MAKLQLRTNVPEIIALQFTTGKEVESTFNGTEVLYSLEDGRSWYVHPSVARKIDALCLGKGEPFEVVKSEAPNKKGFVYDVKHAVASAPPAQAAALPSVETRQSGSLSGQVVHTVVQNAQQQQNTNLTAAQRMMGSLASAIDAIVEAQEYAQKKGLRVTFTGEDVRAVANTLYIDAAKGGR
jgi:hypothetical protein